MDGTTFRNARVNVTVGIFLVISALGIHFFLNDPAYAMACFVVGMVFFAKAMADVRIESEE